MKIKINLKCGLKNDFFYYKLSFNFYEIKYFHIKFHESSQNVAQNAYQIL